MRFHFKSILILMITMILMSCTSERMASIDRGSDVTFREGYPEVRLLAIGLFDDEDIPGITLNVDIVKGSLIYRNRNNQFIANAELQIQIIQLLNGESTTIQNRSMQFDVVDDDPRIVDSRDITTISERIPLGPGTYEILVAVKDETSDNRTVRQARTTIPDPESRQIGITSVLLLGKSNSNDEGFVPVTTYFIPARFDSLKFQYQITRPEIALETNISMELFRFNADSLHAREIAGIPPSPGSIAYRGIDYNRRELVERTERILTTETGNIMIEYVTPVLPSANYRFSVLVENEGEETDQLFKAREFYVSQSPNFPNIESIRELAEPLIYLMHPRDHSRMMKIENPDSLKREIDRFWLSNISNPNKARQVIELYYSRVEQANKQFSNFKEGWRTDMGMVFILFGPPLQVENTLDVSMWYYSYMRNDPLTLFRFTRPKVADQFFPFQHYVLSRQRYYHSVEYDKRRDWLTGSILNMN